MPVSGSDFLQLGFWYFFFEFRFMCVLSPSGESKLAAPHQELTLGCGAARRGRSGGGRRRPRGADGGVAGEADGDDLVLVHHVQAFLFLGGQRTVTVLHLPCLLLLMESVDAGQPFGCRSGTGLPAPFSFGINATYPVVTVHPTRFFSVSTC